MPSWVCRLLRPSLDASCPYKATTILTKYNCPRQESNRVQAAWNLPRGGKQKEPSAKNLVLRLCFLIEAIRGIIEAK